jgi:hypothetical protein
VSSDARVSALEDLLARVRRNSQLPRTSSAAVEAVAEAHAPPLELDPLDALPIPDVPPPSTRTPLDGLNLQRRGTPPQGSRGASPRPPTPMPRALSQSDSSPLHDAVISHASASPSPGRIESSFGLVPPPPRNPTSLRDFVDEPTATGDPEEAERLLLAEQEEAARAQRVRFPTPVPNRPPTPVPPPLTLREPARTPGKPILELDLDSPISQMEPTRPFGRDASAMTPVDVVTSAAQVGITLDEVELDGAKTDRPPPNAAAEEVPPVSMPRLPNLDAIETAALGAPALDPAVEVVPVVEEEPFEPVFDEVSVETRTSRPPAPSTAPGPVPPPLVSTEVQEAPRVPSSPPSPLHAATDRGSASDEIEMARPARLRPPSVQPTFEPPRAPSTEPPAAPIELANEPTSEQSESPAIALSAVFDVAEVRDPSTPPPAVEIAPIASSAHEVHASDESDDDARTQIGRVDLVASDEAPVAPEAPVEAPVEVRSESRFDARFDAGRTLRGQPALPPADATASGEPAPHRPSTAPPDEEERSPSSSRQLRDEVRPIDDRFDGFGAVGDSEPPPQSGEVQSQRYGATEGIVERGETERREEEAARERERASLTTAFESPATEDEAPSRVTIARASSVPEAEERPSARPRPTTEPPVSDPSAGTPPKPPRVELLAPSVDVETSSVPIDVDEIVRASYSEVLGEEATNELEAAGRVDVVERSRVALTGPVAGAMGKRPELESFGALLDATLAIGR